MKVVGRRTGCKRSGIFPLRQQRKEARGRLAHQPRRLLPPRAKRRSSRSGPGEVGGGMAGEKMAKCEPCERSYDNMVKMLEDLNRDLEKLLEDMEKLSVQATWMAYDMVVMRANPDLANSMRRLEDAFLTCKEEMEKNWQEMLKETKSAEPKQ